jgi:hypothetical protein
MKDLVAIKQDQIKLLTESNRERNLMFKVEDLQKQLDFANELKIKTEKDFDDYRMKSYNQKKELGDRANRMHEMQVTTT